MQREKFPERIPFRLTRMLVKAMEVGGVEGTFRSTCESVMSVMRQNEDSLMAILEAFVHDPLMNWKLLETQRDEGNGGREEESNVSNQTNAKATAVISRVIRSWSCNRRQEISAMRASLLRPSTLPVGMYPM